MEKFMKRYYKLINDAFDIAEDAKHFIVDNFEKIKDWSGLEFHITSNNPNTKNEEVIFQNITRERVDSIRSEPMRNIYEEMMASNNPITSFDVIYDTTDGDISFIINGEDFWWVEDEIVIMVADYIENNLKK